MPRKDTKGYFGLGKMSIDNIEGIGAKIKTGTVLLQWRFVFLSSKNPLPDQVLRLHWHPVLGRPGFEGHCEAD